MNCMFCLCYSLISIDLSSFDTTKVRSLNSMFTFCRKLKSCNLSSFDTTKVKDLMYMFNGCSSLDKKNIIVGEKCKNILDEFDTPFVSNVFREIFK